MPLYYNYSLLVIILTINSVDRLQKEERDAFFMNDTFIQNVPLYIFSSF